MSPSKGEEHHFLLILDGRNIGAVEQDVGQAGANEKGGKIHR